jgi:ribosomal protein S12 methylthiotransferase accessory factor
MSEGLLATTIAARLAGADGRVAVVASDGAETGPAPAGPWLSVRVELGTAVVGPMTVPGTPGCATCVRLRAGKARADAEELHAVRDRFADRFRAADARLTGQAATIVAELVADEVGRSAPRTEGGVIRLRLDDLTTSVHRFLPEPLCPDCGSLPDDTAEAAMVRPEPRPKLARDTYRVRDLRAEAETLIDTYVDSQVGVIRGLQRTVYGTYPTTSAPMSLDRGSTGSESGFGRDLDFASAQITAVAEAMERYGGARPAGKRTVVHGSFKELSPDALDPRTLGLYPDERYAAQHFPYERYHEDLAMPWVWGHSFARGEPVLVPESVAYYRMHLVDPAHRSFVYEISNGCALGGCVEEAILHGILELAERDAFLLTWYARLPVRRLDPTTSRDSRIPLMIDRLRAGTGYDVHLFDTTTEAGIPSVWAVAVHPASSADIPKLFCAAASGFDPERAVANALLELAPMVEWRSGSWPQERAAAAAMVADPDLVRQMHDHTIVNAHIDAYDRFDFLLGGDRPAHSFADSFAGAFRPRDEDLSVDLRATVDRYLARGHDVVVVDQTTPEHRVAGLSCVKVLVPGLLPMTFGHWARRVDGLPRLLAAPQSLGYTERRLRPDEVNPHPHPFP